LISTALPLSLLLLLALVLFLRFCFGIGLVLVGVDFVLDCSFVAMIDDHDYDRIRIGASSTKYCR
jgi:hypothetical protein